MNKQRFTAHAIKKARFDGHDKEIKRTYQIVHVWMPIDHRENKKKIGRLSLIVILNLVVIFTTFRLLYLQVFFMFVFFLLNKLLRIFQPNHLLIPQKYIIGTRLSILGGYLLSVDMRHSYSFSLAETRD